MKGRVELVRGRTRLQLARDVLWYDVVYRKIDLRVFPAARAAICWVAFAWLGGRAVVTGELPLARTLLWGVSALMLAGLLGKEDEQFTGWRLFGRRISGVASEVALGLLIGVELAQRDSVVTIAATGASIATYMLHVTVSVSVFKRTVGSFEGGTPEPIVREDEIGPDPEVAGE